MIKNPKKQNFATDFTLSGDKFMFIGVMEDLSARQNLEHVSLPLRGKVARFSVTDE